MERLSVSFDGILRMGTGVDDGLCSSFGVTEEAVFREEDDRDDTVLTNDSGRGAREEGRGDSVLPRRPVVNPSPNIFSRIVLMVMMNFIQ